MKHKSKVAVVVGATGNLGQAIVKRLKNEGYVVDKTWDSQNHPDASKPESYANLPERIDLAVYAVGTNIVKPVHELTNEEWQGVMNANLNGAFYFARAAYHGLKKAKGVFVTISSINSVFPYPDRAAYCTTKAGLEGLTQELAVEWGKDGIATQSIRLGPLNKLMKTTKVDPAMLDVIKKKMPMHALIAPEEVAAFIYYLAEGGARPATGAVYTMDGGYTINRHPLI